MIFNNLKQIQKKIYAKHIYLFFVTIFCGCIKNGMEKFYDDSLMPDNFEEIAKAYSKSLKNKGFVFVRLEEEEFNLLLNEVFVLIEKMLASLEKLRQHLDARVLQERLCEAKTLLCEKFGNKKPHKFSCVEDENNAFLSLVSIENLLIIKLMLLSVKSGEIELCHNIITNIAGIFAESFSCEGFILKP